MHVCTPEWTRTTNLQLRRLLLYPIELRARLFYNLISTFYFYNNFPDFRRDALTINSFFSTVGAVPIHRETCDLPDSRRDALTINSFFSLSGRQDSNLRPPAPKAGALTGLRYAPFFANQI